VNPLFLASAFHLAHSAPGSYSLKLKMICMCSPGTELLSIEMRSYGLCTGPAIQGCWKRISYKVRSSAVRQTATSSWYLFHSDNMSTASDGSDFATFVRIYKQWGESRNQRLEGNPHPLTGSQHPTNQVQPPIAQRLSPSRSRPQPQPY
jgi:hypothetical protein